MPQLFVASDDTGIDLNRDADPDSGTLRRRADGDDVRRN
jgi:hypothetical protein